jgi:5,10-methylenetetrahydrofolate reductase
MNFRKNFNKLIDDARNFKNDAINEAINMMRELRSENYFIHFYIFKIILKLY